MAEKHPFFIRAPQRRQQVPLGSVAGETMDHHLTGNVPQACFQNFNVCILLQACYGSGTPERFQIRAPQHVKQMKFHTGGTAFSNIPGGLHHLFWRLTRQPQNLMDDHADSDCPQLPDGLLKYRQIISPANPGGTFRMNRLQAKFHPYRLDTVELRQ